MAGEAEYVQVHIRKVQRFARGRGYARFNELRLDGDRISTSGILVAQKWVKRGEHSFATLTDGRDQIQLIIPTDAKGLSPEQIKEFRKGTRVTVTGIPFLSGRTPEDAIQSLYAIEISRSISPAPIKFDEEGLQREITPRLLIGRLMSLVSSIFDGLGFRRYEPRFITSSEIDLNYEPLLVGFPGRGADLFLEVSPLPQLLHAAAMTGEGRLYAQTRLFSRAYRDGYTSADSPIVAAVDVALEAQEHAIGLSELTKMLVSRVNEVPLSDLPFDPVPADEIIETRGTDNVPPGIRATLIIRSTVLPPGIKSDYAYDVRKRVSVETRSGQVIIEGHEGCIAELIPYKWLCVHVERLATGDFWRIGRRRGPEAGITS